MANLYLAAYFPVRNELIAARQALQTLGHRVTSRWLDEETVATPDARHWSKIGADDVADLGQADTLVIDTRADSPRGGREVEFGVALKSGLRLFIVGPQRNVFHYLADAVFGSWDAFLAFARGGGLDD